MTRGTTTRNPAAKIRTRVALLAATTALGAGLVLAPGAQASPANAPAVVAGPAAFGCNPVTNHPQIAQGSSGPAVRELQCLLKYWGFDPGATDGQFGSKTRSAVVGFQNKFHNVCGLAVDGIVGPKTWHALLNPGC
ncbi:peptidoglycan-binding domain-containing protein [Streptomyces sp. 4.24]|uniref:peptidoglycan-binding domain-containing protein n=1 Tax=Streptomyces tritrimontium TaxID=3406573 RepID=UPI003BB73E42